MTRAWPGARTYPSEVPRARRSRRREVKWWEELPVEELLDVRLCDLDLRIEGTALEERIRALHDELERAGLRFRPYVWLSTDWFTPAGATGFAIPFFLAHPRLVRLEHRQMYEVEGGNRSWCMKLLRHETGHAIDHAHRLHRRKRWRETFGPVSRPYRFSYAAKPFSKRFVHNLDYWYAQSHPLEDFAETFAVWLRPRSSWRKAYAGWPALAKLQYVDELMAEIADGRAPVRTRERIDSLPRLRTTLREYYRQKKARYRIGQPSSYDRDLLRLFAPGERNGPRRTAAGFLRKRRQELRSRVSTMTGQYRYVVDQALNELIARCRELDLRVTRSESDTLIGAAILLTMLSSRFARDGARGARFVR